MARSLATLFVLLSPAATASAGLEDDWTFVPAREEIAPTAERTASASSEGSLVLRIFADGRDGLAGAWVSTVPIEGGRYYRFACLRRTEGVPSPRRSAVAKITWLDDGGSLVDGEHGDRARPEYPLHEQSRAHGFTQVTDVYRAPASATQARIELHLRWAQHASVAWKDIRLEPVAPPEPRRVRLASVHFRPRGGQTAEDNCRMFAPLIEEAARRHADLVCLGECLTKVGNGLSYVEAAEPIPGPSTAYFAELADEHDLHIVAGLIERDGPVVYNTSVLLDPEGQLVGKYRKVCLPREEIEGGVTPGTEYPVFDTSLGRIGMMICWDVHFPEVARELANRGAEIIAMPIWGGNPRLAAARAIENQVYVISSTYNDRPDWMVTGIWDHRGDLLATADQWGSVIVSDVDLNRRTQWWYLGDFKARIYRERPAAHHE